MNVLFIKQRDDCICKGPTGWKSSMSTTKTRHLRQNRTTSISTQSRSAPIISLWTHFNKHSYTTTARSREEYLHWLHKQTCVKIYTGDYIVDELDVKYSDDWKRIINAFPSQFGKKKSISPTTGKWSLLWEGALKFERIPNVCVNIEAAHVWFMRLR